MLVFLIFCGSGFIAGLVSFIVGLVSFIVGLVSFIVGGFGFGIGFFELIFLSVHLGIFVLPGAPDAHREQRESGNDERNAEDLAFAQAAALQDAVFNNLIFFKEFDEEAHAEIGGDDQARGHAEGHFFAAFSKDIVGAEHDASGDDAHAGFEELRWISWHHIISREDERDGGIWVAWCADNLGVEEVSEPDAVEISQEVFVRIYKNIDKYQPGTRFFTWLYRITYNLAVDKYRRKKTAREVEFDNDYQKNFSSPEDVLPPSLGINPERACERAELRQQLTQAMDELPEKQRTIITLREVEGLSYEEIASVLDIQIGTVMSRLHYARQRLQNNLRKYLECQDIPKKD